MNRTLPCVLLALAISACGGGGGGGGSSSPANVNPGTGNNNGGGNQQQDLQTGVFTDAPVAGLRYRQGSQQVVTDADGQFTYDANSSEKVEFLIGNTSIGFATGAAAVTPFDLQSGPGSLNYHRGINVSRLLVSLDVDSNPANGIEMPADIDSFVGDFPFDLQPSSFAQDEQVVRLLSLNGLSDLVSEADVLDHLADNPIVVQKRNAAIDQLNTLGNVRVRWNPDLDNAGVLADIEAANGERLIILAAGSDALRVGDVLYFDAAGRYVMISYDEQGSPSGINVNNAVLRSLPVNNEWSLAQSTLMLDIGNYKVPLSHVLVDTASGKFTVQQSHRARVDAVSNVMSRLLEGVMSATDMLTIASAVMLDINEVFCDRITDCGSYSALGYALEQALADNAYRERRFALIATGESELSIASLCINTDIAIDGAECGAGIRLDNLVVQLGQTAAGRLAAWTTSSLVDTVGGTHLGYFGFSDREDDAWPYHYDLPLDAAVPDPWLEATARYEYRVSVNKLDDDHYFVDTVLIRQVYGLRLSDCGFVLQENGAKYDAQCRNRRDADVSIPEDRAIADLLNDLLRVSRRYSVIISRDTFNGVKFVSDPYYKQDLSLAVYSDDIQRPIAVNLLAGVDRHMEYQALEEMVNPGVVPRRFWFGVEMDDTNLNGGIANLFLRFNGWISDSRLRKGSGSVSFLVACDQQQGCRNGW